MTETTQRILELMEINGDNAYSLEKKAELPISSITSWKKGKFKPSGDAVIKIAKYYNVSTDYLFCLTDEPKPYTKSSITERTTSTLYAILAKDQRFVNSAKLYKAMPDEFQREVYAYIFGIAVGLGLNVKQILGK